MNNSIAAITTGDLIFSLTCQRDFNQLKSVKIEFKCLGSLAWV